MARIIDQTKVGHVGNADFGWRLASVECFEATDGGVTEDYKDFEEK